MANIGVITEQGYPAGQFGYKPISEAERKEIEAAFAKKEAEKNKK